jgi:hypothetical protein
MSDENPVYLKLEYDESLESKRDILSSEMFLLNIIKIIKRYDSLREEELELKNQLYKNIKEFNTLLKKARVSFPFLKLPENLKREDIRTDSREIKKGKYADEDLESQLRQIQEKLRDMER